VKGGLWLGLGYMLSPLSWWNNVFFNLRYGFASIASLDGCSRNGYRYRSTKARPADMAALLVV
jgi:hypothetical protein